MTLTRLCLRYQSVLKAWILSRDPALNGLPMDGLGFWTEAFWAPGALVRRKPTATQQRRWGQGLQASRYERRE